MPANKIIIKKNSVVVLDVTDVRHAGAAVDVTLVILILRHCDKHKSPHIGLFKHKLENNFLKKVSKNKINSFAMTMQVFNAISKFFIYLDNKISPLISL